MISTDNQELALMQKKQLEMLRELDRVCRLIGVNYYLSSGTCLGAVRHGGFIPWDDDIDVYMKWDDAEKLVENQGLFAERYFVQSRKTDPNVNTTHYRLRDSQTAMFLEDDKGLEMNHGIFIDIYILYPYPDNKFKAHKIIIDSFIYRILVAKSGPANHGKVAQIVGNLIYGIYKGQRADNKIKKVEKEYRFNGGKKYYATYFGRDISIFKSIIYPQSWFKNPKVMKFEDMDVMCPGEVEEYCRLQYGDSYMELPPEEKRIPHHEYIYASVDEPYTKFKGIYY
jgi:lipopolysaccharide cholinephosphotransferase